ncbi:MAG: ABC transporter permease [Bacteriovoracia bacterium]
MSAEGFRWSRAAAIARKEIAHIARDPFTIALSTILPMLVVLIFGFAIEFNLTRIPTAYLDSDRTQGSRAVVETFGSSDYFRMAAVETPDAGLRAVEAEDARALIVIPPQFERDVISGRGADVQVLIDGADGTVVGSVTGYLREIQRRSAQRMVGAAVAGVEGAAPAIPVHTRFLYNPELSSRWFVVPGLVVVVMSILSILLTALTVAREWENGSMELLLSTPVRPLEVILGKLSPYAALGLAAVTIVYFMARWVFGVPFQGNHLVFLLGVILFLVTYLAQGLLISVATRKQTLAMQFAMLTGLLPSQLLSGFIFPVESMPTFFQYFTMILPARWFMTIARDSFLQGSSLWTLRGPFFALAVIATVLIALSVRRFKKDVEP